MKSYLIIGLLIILFGCVTKENVQRPNILFVTTDCQAWEDMPVINPTLKLPTLQRIAREGVLFENHYSVAPSNLPSRYSIISGQYPHKHKMMDDAGGNWLPEFTPVLMEQLAAIGYQTIGIGKMEFKPWERMAGFQVRVIADGKGTSVSDTLKKDDYYYYLKKAHYTRWDYLKQVDQLNGSGVYEWPLNDTLDIDYFVGNETVKLLSNGTLNGNNPWFMWVSFNGPQYPWDTSTKKLNDFLNRQFQKPRIRLNELSEKPISQTSLRNKYLKSIVSELDKYPGRREEICKEIRAGSYADLEEIDNQLSRIIQALEKRKEIDNTIIVFTSINGSELGDHNLYSNGNFYERSAHVPFIIWWPGHTKNKNCSGFSSHVDLLPTFIDFAGGNIPDSVEGKSLKPILDAKSNGRDHVFLEVLNNYAIVTSRFKFGIYTPYNENELYDRIIDPNELYNVTNDAKYQHIIDSLTNLMVEFNPSLKNLIENRKDLPNPVTAIDLNQGDNLFGYQVPYFPGKPLKMIVDVKFSKKNANGHIVTYDIENLHGFSLFIDEGKLYFGIRKYNKEFDYLIPGEYKDKRYKFTISIRSNGLMSCIDNINNQRYFIQTGWPLPVQPGNPFGFERTICAGISGNGWIEPFGKLIRGKDIDGELFSCLVSVGND